MITELQSEYSQQKVNLSSLSKEKVKEILEELALEVVGDDSIPKLANYLDVSKQTLYDWKDNKKIVIKSVKSKIPNVNPRFLRYGEYPILLEKNLKDAPSIANPDEIDPEAFDELSVDGMMKYLEHIELLSRNVRGSLRRLKNGTSSDE